MSKLNISDDLFFPFAIASQGTSIFGTRGSGKTNTAGVMEEELLRAGQPTVIIDPTDAWWGLRAGRDGDPAKGFQVLIFGGSHADMALEESHGKQMAEFIVQERASIILSMRHLRKSAQRRLVTDLLEELFHLKGKDENRTPLTVIIDEAPIFAPSKAINSKGDYPVTRTLGAVEDLIARGRNTGFGVILVSQRPATLNADVRSLCDTIICHRITGPLDRAAIKLWVEENASVEQMAELLKSLALLKNGEAWVWSPALDIMNRVQIRLRDSYDSSASPKPGQKLRPPKKLAEVDLDKWKGRFAASIEQAKANDPAALKRRIAELEKQLASRPKEQVEKVVEKIVEIPVLKNGQLERTEKILGRLQAFADKALAETGELRRLIAPASAPRPVAKPTPVARSPMARPAPAARVAPVAGTASDSGIDKCARKILAVLANYPDGAQIGKIALLSGYRVSGGFRNSLSALRTAGFIVGENTGTMVITEAGISNATPENIPTGQDLVNYWLNHASLDKCAKAILSAFVTYLEGMGIEDLAKTTGYEVSGGFRNSLSDLRTAGVIIGKNTGIMRLSDELLQAATA